MIRRAGSLFTGTAALDMAAAEVFDTELVWLSEYEPPTKKNRKPAQAASRLLAHHFPNVPNLGDITKIDWGLVAKLSPIDLLTAGWPCQPFSLAGLQLGADDDRALWPYVDGCLRALRPRYVLLENVPAVTGAELERVANTLAPLGYRFAWVCFPASAVGGPHQRERFFLLAVADTKDERHERPRPTRRRRARPANGGDAAADTAGSGPQGSVGPGTPPGAQPQAVADAERGGGAPAADPARGGCGADQLEDAARERDAARRGQAAADANGGRLAGHPERDVRPAGGLAAPQRDDAERRVLDWAGYGPAIRRWESVLGRPAPAPTTVGARGGEVLNPALVEWMMGLPEGWITAVPGLTRTQQIKLGGNGVVTLQAVAAYRYLLDVLERDEERAA